MASKSKFTKFVGLARSRGWVAFCLALWLLGLGLSGSAREPSFITFEAPGAATGSFQGTIPFAINPAGAITGYYVDMSSTLRSFLRASDGSIATFAAPGAGTGSGYGTIA